jgi:hypothetical protein
MGWGGEMGSEKIKKNSSKTVSELESFEGRDF